MFVTVNKMNYQIPTFDYEDASTWDKYQRRMKENLFTLSREKDPIKIDREVDSWLSIARNGSEAQCMSMLSVIVYFYPARIHDSYFKSRIEYFFNTLVNIVKTKINEAMHENPLKSTKKSASVSSTPVTEVNVPKAKKTDAPQEDREFETAFPTFSEGGFPDSDSDVFDNLLKDENKAHGDDCKE